MLMEGGAMACWPGDDPSCGSVGNSSELCIGYEMLGPLVYPVLSNIAELGWPMSGIC